jgi:excisionase family DNA binding protein
MTILETLKNTDTLLTVEELSRLLTLSPKTLYKAIASGKLPAYHIGGAKRLEPSEVAEWLHNRHSKN